MDNMRYYVIFFDKEHSIKKAHEAKTYPTVKDIVYLLKSLEKSDLSDIEDLMMDIITEEQFKQINLED